MSYRPRVVDAELAARLTSSGAVVVEGPKACGKTETGRRTAASEVRVDTDPRVGPAMQVDPRLLLDASPPLLLDEWQVQPRLWDHVRRAVDDRGLPGQFILTGSATPSEDSARHSGAGRFARLRMRPMSLLETEVSDGAVSLRALFDGDAVRATGPDLGLPALIDCLLTGGWPGLQHLSPPQASAALRDYLATIREVDVAQATGTRHDPLRIARLLTALARSTASEVSVTTLARDVGDPLSRNTVDAYLDALRRLMILDEQPAWSVHLRSSATLRRAPKRHLADPSLAVAALGASAAGLLRDLNTLGLLFESLVVRDLRVYTQPHGGEVLHYRDSTGLEVDAIVTDDTGRWGALEVKLGAGQVDAAAEALRRFADRVDTSRVGAPAFLGVVTPSGFGYTRRDGVHVVPVGRLGT